MSQTIKVNNGDWVTDSRGRFYLVSGREKCAQDLANFQLQDLNEDGTQGSELGKIEKGSVVDTVNAHKALIQTLVSEAVDRLTALQDQEHDISDEERISTYNITVQRVAQQSLSYSYLLTVETEAAGEPITTPFVIELEQVRDPQLEDVVPFAAER